MPAVEVKDGKYLMVKEEPPGSGNYVIPLDKTPSGDFKIPIYEDSGTEPIYVQKAVDLGGGKWILPLIEHRDGNGEVPIEKKH